MLAPTRVKRARPDGTGNVYLDPANQSDGAQFGTRLAEFATAVTGSSSHWLAISDAERRSMASKRMRLEELVAMASAVQLPIIMPDCVGQPDPKLKWTIRPSSCPRDSTEFELTHTRRVPLPFAIELTLCGQSYSCLYAGHGQSKIVYRIDDKPLVLKLTAKTDQEPEVCTQLSLECRAAQPAIKICPTVYVVGPCEEQNLGGKFKAEWFGWIAEYATPLDKYMARLTVDHVACLKLALFKQVVAAQHGLLLSDNNLFNFGVLDDTVVIIDTGSRTRQTAAISKGTMNDYAIYKWWKKLASLPS